MSTNRTLILTTAISYRWPALAPFFDSLRRTGYRGDVTVLVEDKWLHPEDYASLEAAGASTVPINAVLSRVPVGLSRLRFHSALGWLHRNLPALAQALPGSAARRQARRDRMAAWFHPIMSARLYLYRCLLQQHAHRYDTVILCDSRDVIFQTAPEAWVSSAPLNVFLEPSTVTIASEPNNARWIRLLYGEQTLGRIGHHRVSCAGVVHGTTAGITDYLDAMTEALLPQTTTIAGVNSFDQGVHNYLLRSDTWPRVRIWENGAGLVLNMFGLPAGGGPFAPGDDGLIRGPDGQAVPIVHQYDRHPAVQTRLLETLALNPEKR